MRASFLSVKFCVSKEWKPFKKIPHNLFRLLKNQTYNVDESLYEWDSKCLLFVKHFCLHVNVAQPHHKMLWKQKHFFQSQTSNCAWRSLLTRLEQIFIWWKSRDFFSNGMHSYGLGNNMNNSWSFHFSSSPVPRMLLDGRKTRLLRWDRLPRLLPHADPDPPHPGQEIAQALPQAHQRCLPIGRILW